MFNVDKTGSALGFKVPFANMDDMQDRILGVKGVDIDGTTHYLVTNPLDIDKEPIERKNLSIYFWHGYRDNKFALCISRGHI